jgi:hypothetical protein
MFSPLCCARSWTFKVIDCICGLPLDHVGTHLLFCSHGEEHITPHDVIPDVLPPLQKHKISCFTWVNPCPLTLLSSAGWHHVISRWHLHLCNWDDRQPHPSRLGLSNYFISHGGHDMSTQAKEKLYHNWHSAYAFFSPCHKGFWVPTSMSEQFFPSMHKHGMVSYEHWWPSFDVSMYFL